MGSPPALVTLDLGTETLELDMDALSNLQSPYMIDTAVSTLIAVAVVESARYSDEAAQTTFAAPPVSPLVSDRKSKAPSPYSASQASPLRQVFRRSSKSSSASKRRSDSSEKDLEKRKLPPVTRGILSLLGFSFDAIVWLLSLGVKVLTRLLVGVSGAVEKV